MGCFDSTCSVTRMPVHVDDKVLLVCVEGKFRIHLATTYELANVIYRARYESSRPWQDEVITSLHQYNPEYSVFFGTYNDYGWIEEEDRIRGIEGEDISTFFIHKWVVDEICGCNSQTMPELEMLEKLCRFAFLARIQLFGNHLLGEQYGNDSPHECEAHKLALSIMQKAVEKTWPDGWDKRDEEEE